MRVKTAITVASALFAVGGGCSRPWQASTADLAPLDSPPYGQTRYSNYLIRLHSTRTVNGLCYRTHRALCRNRKRRLRGRVHARSRRSRFPPPPHTNSSRDLPKSGKVEAAAPLQQRPEKPELENPRWRGELMPPAPSNRTLWALIRPSYLGSTPPFPKQDGVFACEPCSLLVV